MSTKRATPAALLGRTEKLSVEFDGLTVNFDCQPRKFTSALEQEIRSADTTSEGLARLIVAVVPSWDLLESDEPDAKPYPITTENLATLPVEFLSQMAERITGALGPNLQSTTASASG